jgi:hypothetical protein
MYNIRNIGIASIIDPNAYNTKKCYSHITILNTYNSKQNTKKLLLHTSWTRTRIILNNLLNKSEILLNTLYISWSCTRITLNKLQIFLNMLYHKYVKPISYIFTCTTLVEISDLVVDVGMTMGVLSVQMDRFVVKNLQLIELLQCIHQHHTHLHTPNVIKHSTL